MYLNMELAIPSDGDRPDFTKATKNLRDRDGLTIGRDRNNQILDTRMYEVEYKDRHKALLANNVIAENMFAQIDEEGFVMSYSRRSFTKGMRVLK